MIDIITAILDAFMERLPKGVVLVPKCQVKPSKFPAIKVCTVEVWKVQDGNTELISDVKVTARMVETSEKMKTSHEVIQKTVVNLLEYYGI